MNHKLAFIRKRQNKVIQQRISLRNFQEEEHIDDTPSSSKRQFKKKGKHSQNHNNVEKRRRKSARNHEEVVDISSSSETSAHFSPNLNTTMRPPNSLHKRLQTCNPRATVVTMPPPELTIDLSNSVNGETDNSDIIEIDDSTIHSNSDVMIVEDASDEFSPVKRSSNSRRLGLGECPVCLEDLSNKEIMSTICGHVFCSSCINGVLKTNKKCPNCRNTLTLTSIHTLFI